MSYNEDFPHGSARFASDHEIAAAGLYGGTGLQCGYGKRGSLHVGGDAPALIIGGAGCGKLTTMIAYMACDPDRERTMYFDPRGEISAISMHNAARKRRPEYRWNPANLPGPHQNCNPLDFLQRGDPSLTADCLIIARSLIPKREGGTDSYFITRAQDWTGGFIKAPVLRDGGTSLPELFRNISAVESDRHRWASLADFMLNSGDVDLRRIVGEMLKKQQESPREFGSTMGEIYAHLGFLGDPRLQASLENPQFSLSDLSDPETPCNIGVLCPVEYIQLWSPVLRLFFTVAKLYKQRRPHGPRVTMIVDEAGQLGHFDTLLEGFTFGRGAGTRTIAVLQDIGQIIRNYGAPTLQSFMGSAQTRIFLGIRDLQTAQMVSSMLGDQTLQVDDRLLREEARRAQIEASRRIFEDEDPLAAAFDHAHQGWRREYRRSQRRALMTPDEILAMPEDRFLMFVSGKNLPPIYGYRYPYFARPEMAGKYLPNPWHPPTDSLTVRTRFGNRRVRVITEPVPTELAHLPQYQDGYWIYPEGYRPI